VDDFDAYAKQCVERYDFLCNSVPQCPKCDTFQVQAIKTEAPAVWKCRVCKHRWGFEPPARS
jgi:ribosomal protein L37AE/L43A